MSTIEKYNAPMRALHWIISISIISLIAVGLYMAGIADDAPDKYALYPYHKAFGFTVLILVFARIITRLRSAVPAPLQTLQPWEIKLSKVTHLLLYVGMIAMPVSGYFMSSYYPFADGINMYFFTVPEITGKDKVMSGIFHQIHEYGSWALIAAVSLHFVGVLKHKFFDKGESDVLKRML